MVSVGVTDAAVGALATDGEETGDTAEHAPSREPTSTMRPAIAGIAPSETDTPIEGLKGS
jgi:hypothetical protein